MKPRLALWLIIILVLVAVVIDIPKIPKLEFLSERFPLKLGLDLQGGTELILQTDMSQVDSNDKDNALEGARQIIENRVNLFGVSEAVVQSSKIGEQRRILIELPGLKDASSAASLVGKTAKLDFREITASAEAEASSSGIPVILLASPTGLTGADLKPGGAKVIFGSGGNLGGSPQVSIEFTNQGAEKFAQITKRNIGKPLAIFLDDQPIEAPTVQQEIVGGSAVISGQFTTKTAKDLVIQLNAGALPVPVKIVDQRTVGPTLGQESINKSIIAGVIGLLIVMIYMVGYYGLWGLIANLALVIYAILILAIFKTGLFILPPITLTLAGIAAFILSIGMAVDANILIFERMREEKRWGRSNVQALDLGFKRAWTSIWASNVSSLITALILYNLGSSLVKGFAITLAIGVLVSMFTAISVSRTFLRLIIK